MGNRVWKWKILPCGAPKHEAMRQLWGWPPVGPSVPVLLAPLALRVAEPEAVKQPQVSAGVGNDTKTEGEACVTTADVTSNATLLCSRRLPVGSRGSMLRRLRPLPRVPGQVSDEGEGAWVQSGGGASFPLWPVGGAHRSPCTGGACPTGAGKPGPISWTPSSPARVV